MAILFLFESKVAPHVLLASSLANPEFIDHGELLSPHTLSGWCEARYVSYTQACKPNNTMKGWALADGKRAAGSS
eukprot:6189373-Pleurochrysis_carterae.AAC.5